MDAEIIKVFAQVAGIGGISLGVLLLVYKDMLSEKFLSKLTKKHSFELLRLMLILVWSVAIFGIGVWAYTSRAEKPPDFSSYDMNEPIPFGTGWVFVGYYDFDHDTYIEGPYAQVVFKPVVTDKNPELARIGDILSIRKTRNIVIARYKTKGLKHQLDSPPLVKEVLSDEDYTGVKLAKGDLVLVRDVEISASQEKRASVWCRVAACDADNPSCQKAAAGL